MKSLNIWVKSIFFKMSTLHPTVFDLIYPVELLTISSIVEQHFWKWVPVLFYIINVVAALQAIMLPEQVEGQCDM